MFIFIYHLDSFVTPSFHHLSVTKLYQNFYSRLNLFGVFPIPRWPPGVRVAKGFGLILCVCKRNFSVLLHSAHYPFTSFKLPQTVSYTSISSQQALPIPALTDRPPFCMRQNMELFHPVRSCTHLFSTSKTQGLCGVMIGFLLCNLLEFSLSHQQDGTMLSFPLHTHTQRYSIYTL